MAVAVTGENQAEAFIRSEHRLLIDGEWVESASGETFATLNPATEETLTEVAHGQAPDIERAVKARAGRAPRPRDLRVWSGPSRETLRRRYGGVEEAWTRLRPVPA